MTASTRWIYALACACVIALGLASRRFGAQWGHWVTLYAGDVLWAGMVLLALACLLPHWRQRSLGAFALALCWAVEFSQLIQAPWLNGLRRTGVGALLLGRGFLWSDLACYAVGVALGLVVKQVLDGLFRKGA
jgi:hypothetical protein